MCSCENMEIIYYFPYLYTTLIFIAFVPLVLYNLCTKNLKDKKAADDSQQMTFSCDYQQRVSFKLLTADPFYIVNMMSCIVF